MKNMKNTEELDEMLALVELAQKTPGGLPAVVKKIWPNDPELQEKLVAGLMQDPNVQAAFGQNENQVRTTLALNPDAETVSQDSVPLPEQKSTSSDATAKKE